MNRKQEIYLEILSVILVDIRNKLSFLTENDGDLVAKVRDWFNGDPKRINKKTLALECFSEANFIHRLPEMIKRSEINQTDFSFLIEAAESYFQATTIEGGVNSRIVTLMEELVTLLPDSDQLNNLSYLARLRG